tara:strand:+ start:696 stop:1010 length:315 start_codon:yes stop_codon:yes gene_type:complete
MKNLISSKVYLIVGFTITILSYILDKIITSNSMKPLMLIGIIILIIGIGKIFLEKAINMGKVKKTYKHTPEYYKKHHSHKFCEKCGYKLRETFNFCYNCGQRSL